MKKWFAACILSCGLTTTAFAETTEPQGNPPHLSVVEADLQNVFSKDEKDRLDIAVLSQQEMRETKGAWIWMAYYFAPAATSVGYSIYNSSAYMPLYHLSHFATSWRR
ncbi:hypothetical protein ABIC71_004660 [Herbaspirillum seropedicae]|uniref:hypothetical protein n=1 Tax=Herbaspirillum seropedicae TaxID=964 RepID=UPI0033932956